MTRTNNSPKPVSAWLAKMADAEDFCRSVAVGGMAAELLGAGSQRACARFATRVWQAYRICARAKGWSVEQLAERADVEIGEIVDIEQHDYTIPQPRTVYQLANVFGLPSRQLVEVAGLATPRCEVDTACASFCGKV